MQASLSVAVMPAAVVLTVVVAAVNSSGVMDELSGLPLALLFEEVLDKEKDEEKNENQQDADQEKDKQT